MSFLKSIWKANSKHKKLSEELALQKDAKEEEKSEQPELIENENDVITYKLKYLGSTVVEKIVGDNINTEAVKNIIKVAKAGRKKMQRVNLSVSLKGIAVTDLQGNDVFKVSIYRISNCSTDAQHRQVFSFVSTDSNETMECHAFICSKRKMAETVTLAVAHAFSTAYEAWRILPATKEFEKSSFSILKENEKNEIINSKTTTTTTPTIEIANSLDSSSGASDAIAEEKLIDFDDDLTVDAFFGTTPNEDSCFNSQWVCFDDDFMPPETQHQRNAFNQSDLVLA